MTEKKINYFVEIDGEKFTRKSHRKYEYVVVVRGISPEDCEHYHLGNPDKHKDWGVLSWCGRHDLAVKAEKSKAARLYIERKIVPVQIEGQ